MIKLWQMCKSIHLAAATMILLLTFSVYGMVINDKAFFRSSIFLVLGSAFLFNLLCCTIEQTRKLRLHRPLNIWGSVIFHWGMVLICLGGLITFATKAEGYIVLGKGQALPLNAQAFSVLDKGKYLNDWPEWLLTLKDQKQYWNSDQTIDYTASLLSIQKQSEFKEQWLEKGIPFIEGAWRFYHYAAGYAPGITIKDGDKLVGGFFLSAEKTEDLSDGYTIKPLQILSDLKIKGKFYPDAEKHQSDRITNPILLLETTEGIKEVSQGDKVQFGRYTIELGELGSWIGLQVVYDQGAFWVFSGSFLAVFGLILWYYSKVARRIKDA